MSVLNIILNKEKLRTSSLIDEYENELKVLPKGKLIPKNRNGNRYYYLCYRDGTKVISKYIGKDENVLFNINEGLIRRKQIESIIKKLYEEKNKIEKMEELL